MQEAALKEEILRRARDLKVSFIRLQFTDILGIFKNVAIPYSQLEKALDGQLSFDGSAIEGFVRVEESDMFLKPDPQTFTLLPWKPQEAPTARLICDIYNVDGTPFAGCPRCNLRRVLAQAAELGLTYMVGAEPEFFLFHRTPEGQATTQTHDQASYFDLSPVDFGENVRRDAVLTLREMGFSIESSHHEVAPGQHEIDLRYADALTMADQIMTLRFAVRTVAYLNNLHATFMPKPVFGVNGSGMHLHQSLFRDRENAFYAPGAEDGLSILARQFIAGLILHARGYTAVTNPLVNSYKRLVPGYEAPVYIAWSDQQNRSPLLRVPARRGEGTRVELRSPDPSCNPYLALAAMLQAGLDGVRRELAPPPPVNRNIFRMTAKERAEAGIRNLPASLEEALNALFEDSLVQEALGEHIFRNFLEAKKIEWDVYRSQVHPWEVEQYLTTF
ncbi:MAG: glutamine synthetase family protein [Thermaerobacter sp.]|nr:glutamine synthetase family protein [Thermaerobacter sp.]